MNCPKCQAPMAPVTFDEVTVDRCTGCQGIWFDGQEQKKLAAARGSETIDSGDIHVGRKMNQITDIKCPRCQGPMESVADVDQHHITFETCRSCQGIFLDAGEFKDLKSYTLLDYLRGLFKHRTKKIKN